jgi:hypothetical protein
MRTQLHDLSQELKDIERTLIAEVSKDLKQKLLKRKEVIKSIIYNIY